MTPRFLPWLGDSLLGGPVDPFDTAPPHMSSNLSEPLITKAEVARRLGLPEIGVKNLVRRRVIPVIRLGHRTVRFRWSEVEAAVDRYRQREIR